MTTTTLDQTEQRTNGRERMPSQSAPVVLSVRNLSVAYRSEPAIEDVTFDVRAGERLAIIGPNGAGKSTLIQAVLGLLQPRSGEVALYGLAPYAIGYVPQHEAVNWDFPVTVRDVVMLGRTRKIGWLRWPGAREWRAVDAALDRVGMLALAGRQVGELSGGQRRRVFIARALAQEARMLALDEPFSGVDVQAQNSLMDVLDSLSQDGLTLLLSTHDLNLAFHRFDRVLALRHRMIAYGPPRSVYSPAILKQLYGSKLAVWEEGEQVAVFVDDHACDVC